MMNLKMRTVIILFSSTVFTLTVFMFSGCDNNDDNEPAPVKLTSGDSLMLVQMREEEKLARDVYNTLYAKWNTRIFSNIASSEQTHMDRVLDLLNKFGIPDPASAEPGKFNNADLQNLYNALVAKGDSSLVNALFVGATIEDLDIYDLEEFMDKTENEDILSVFGFLDCGSRNHMRAFVSQLESNGESYMPVYITEKEFNEIIASDKEQCGQNP